MRIVDLLKKQSIDLGGHGYDKAGAISHLVNLMAVGGNIADVEGYKK